MADLSVIIPAYNAAGCLPEAIQSVLDQNFDDLEIIVVDDCSTDHAESVLKPYIESSRIRYLRHDRNRGAGAARNTGIKASSGQFISFLDADDLLLDTSLLKRMVLLHKRPDVGLVFSDYDLQNEEKRIDQAYLRQRQFLSFFDRSIEWKQGEETVFWGDFYQMYLAFIPYPIWTGTVMIRNDVIRSAGYFREDLSVAEDLEFWLRIAECSRIGFIDASLAVYRHYRSTLTRGFERYYLDTIEALYSIQRRPYPDDAAVMLRIGEAWFELGYYYFQKGRPSKARNALEQSAKYKGYDATNRRLLILSYLPRWFLKVLSKNPLGACRI